MNFSPMATAAGNERGRGEAVDRGDRHPCQPEGPAGGGASNVLRTRAVSRGRHPTDGSLSADNGVILLYTPAALCYVDNL